MDTTDRVINDLTRIVKTSETTLEPKTLMELDMMIEGLTTRKINLFNLIKGKQDIEFETLTMEIVKKSFNKARTIVTQRIEDFTSDERFIKEISTRTIKTNFKDR